MPNLLSRLKYHLRRLTKKRPVKDGVARQKPKAGVGRSTADEEPKEVAIGIESPTNPAQDLGEKSGLQVPPPTHEPDAQAIRQLTEELTAAKNERDALRKFLSTYDDVSAEDVRDLLKSLNDSVEELAVDASYAWLAQEEAQTEDPDSSQAILSSEAIERLARFLGRQLIEAVQSARPTDRAALVLLQVVLRACVLSYMQLLLGRFTAAVDLGDGDAVLSALGRAMHRSESQPVYGQWRSLAHIHSRQTSYHAESLLNECADSALTDIRYIMLLLLGDSQAPLLSEVKESLGEKILEAMRQTVKLVTVLREQIISSDYETFAPQPGVPFDLSKMVPIETVQAPEDENAVQCTTRLGATMRYKPGRQKDVAMQEVAFEQAEVVTTKCLKVL